MLNSFQHLQKIPEPNSGQALKQVQDDGLEMTFSSLILLRKVPKTYENIVILNQLTRSITSVGANDQEADGVTTRNDFIHCYTIVRKELKETYYWLRLLSILNNVLTKQIDYVLTENDEIIRIISSIIYNTQKKH